MILRNEIPVDVKVLTGTELSDLVLSNITTTKRQARFAGYGELHDEPMVVGGDTPATASRTTEVHDVRALGTASPVAPPDGNLLSMTTLARLLAPLVGAALPDPGPTQDRLRGQALHAMVCEVLGYSRRVETGQHPDIPHQLLELKLQTSPTIDLGLVHPTSMEPLVLPLPGALAVRDIRYAVFGAVRSGASRVVLRRITLVAGANFHQAFPAMGGLGVNGKIQIRLAASWFA